jgi:hypothetical protein
MGDPSLARKSQFAALNIVSLQLIRLNSVGEHGTFMSIIQLSAAHVV